MEASADSSSYNDISLMLSRIKRRIPWMLALLLLLWAALSTIHMMVSRFFTNPTYLVVEDSMEDALRFPLVALCPEVNFPDHKMDQFLDEIKLPATTNRSYVRSILRELAAYYSPDVVFTIDHLEILQQVLDYNQLEIAATAERLTASCKETLLKHFLHRCRWRSRILNCSELFFMVLTTFGFCCVFNGRSLKKEMQLYGFSPAPKTPRILSKDTGPRSGLMLAVNQSQELGDIDLSYKWLTLQGGREYMEAIKNGTALSAGLEHWASVRYQVFRIDESALTLGDDLRHCRMTSDRLKYFPLYTKRTCHIECEMNRTLTRCGCVRVSHPRPPGAAICLPRNLLCARRSAVPLGSDQCPCPMACNFAYKTITIQTYDMEPGRKELVDHFYDDLNFAKVSVVRIFIEMHNTVFFYRNAFFTPFSLFSQLGGIFNVFFGCSILTLVELLQLIRHAVRMRWTARVQNLTLEKISKKGKKKTRKEKKLQLPYRN